MVLIFEFLSNMIAKNMPHKEKTRRQSLPDLIGAAIATDAEAPVRPSDMRSRTVDVRSDGSGGAPGEPALSRAPAKSMTTGKRYRGRSSRPRVAPQVGTLTRN
jgi:hypothetical protein